MSFFSPIFAITIGWVLPSLVSYYPLENVVTLTGAISLSAHQLALTLSVFSLPILFFYDKKCNVNLDKRVVINSNIYSLVSYTLYLVSYLGYLLALAGSSFKLPFFQYEISAAAENFFRIVPFSGLMYSMGELAAILSLIIIVATRKQYFSFSIIRSHHFHLIMIYMALGILSGKRMSTVLLVFSFLSLVSLLKPAFFTVKKATVFGVSILLFFLVNAYFRALFGFENYYEGLDLIDVDNVVEFTLLQPFLYIQPNFYNLSQVIESNDLTLGVHSIFNMFETHAINDVYSEVRNKTYNMTTFMSPLVQDFGVYATLVLSLVAVFVLSFLKRVSSNGVFLLLIYLILINRTYLLFTGDLFFNNVMIVKTIFCITMFFILEYKLKYE
jgi:hypothetical protein